MIRSRPVWFVAGLLAASALVTPTIAHQNLPVAPPPKAAEGDDQTKAKAGRPLNSESLSEMLDNMGYDFQTNKLPTGYVIHTVTVSQSGWKFVVEMSVSLNGAYVWLIAPLSALPAPGNVPSESLALLLRENWSIYPHVFCMPQNARRLYLQRALENTNVTPGKLREAVDAITGTIRSTAGLWDVSKWSETTSGGKKTPDEGTVATPDTTEGLTKLTMELLAAAKSGKRGDLAAIVKTLVIPNHGEWFKRVFGSDLGATLAEEYATGLPQFESALTRMFLTAAEEGQTEVQVFKFTKPDPDKANGNQNRALEAMAVKTALYSVYLTQPGEESGMHLYSFVHVDGAFRFAGKMRATAARTSGFRGPAGFETVIPAFPAAPALRPNSQPDGRLPQVNPITPSFGSPQLFAPAPLGFRPPAAPTPGANELNPENFRHLTPFRTPGLAPGLAPLGGQFPTPKKKQPPAEDEPSIVGTWRGDVSLGGTKWKVTTTFRSNGTYRSIMEYLDHIIASKGTYTYADGILTTEPEDGVSTTFTITFIDEDTVKAKGGGFTITYKRQ